MAIVYRSDRPGDSENDLTPAEIDGNFRDLDTRVNEIKTKAIAEGALSSGDVVVLRSDGTINIATNRAEGIGAETAVVSSVRFTSTIYYPPTNKIIVVYSDYSSYIATAIVGTVSGATISFGDPIAFGTDQSNSNKGLAYDIDNDKIIILYRDGYSFGRVITGTVSGTTIIFDASVLIASNEIGNLSAAYDPDAGNTIIVYEESNTAFARICTVGESSLSVSGATSLGLTFLYGLNIRYHSFSQFILTYEYQTSAHVAVVTVDGTNVVLNTPTEFSDVGIGAFNTIYDKINSKLVITYDNYAVLGTVTGVDITLGTPITYYASTVYNMQLAQDLSDGKIVIMYQLSDNTVSVVAGTISGDSISFAPPTVVSSVISSNIDICYFPTDKFLLFYTLSNNCKVVLYQFELRDADNWIGIAAADYAIGEEASFYAIGAIADNQVGLIANKTYYLTDDGLLTTVDNGRKVGRALSETSLLITNSGV